MVESHLVEVKELSPNKLCGYIEHKHYLPIKQLLSTITLYIEEWTEESSDIKKVEMLSILFYRLKDEIEQLFRNDTMIIFPLIQSVDFNEPGMSVKIPGEMIRNKNKKIMYLMDKIKGMANGYLSKPNWTTPFRILCEELHNLEQQVLQTIYLKENVLLPKIEKG